MKRENENGQSLIELALTMPVLMLFLLGALELAQVCYGAINVSNAAKSASQFGAQDSDHMVDTDGILTAAQNEVSIPGQQGALDMPMPTSMPDGTTLPTSALTCSTSTSGTSYACSYCTCSNPDIGATPFKCSAAAVSGPSATCTGISHLEQNLIVTTHAVVAPLVTLPGLQPTYDLYGHAVVKRLQ